MIYVYANLHLLGLTKLRNNISKNLFSMHTAILILISKRWVREQNKNKNHIVTNHIEIKS